MTAPNESSTESATGPLIELQLLVTHLQRDLETLNQVVLDQQRQLDALRAILDRMDDRLSRTSPESETFDPQLERPPHY